MYESLEKNEILQLSSERQLKSHVKVDGQLQAAENGRSIGRSLR